MQTTEESHSSSSKAPSAGSDADRVPQDSEPRHQQPEQIDAAIQSDLRALTKVMDRLASFEILINEAGRSNPNLVDIGSMVLEECLLQEIEQPLVANYLVEHLLKEASPLVSEALVRVLEASSLKRIKLGVALFQLTRNELQAPQSFTSRTEASPAVQKILERCADDPEFVRIMVDKLDHPTLESYWVARALRASPFEKVQPMVREKLRTYLRDHPSHLSLDNLWAVPYALDPNDEASIPILLEAITARPSPDGYFDSAAIDALSEAELAELPDAALARFYGMNANWNVNSAAIELIKPHLDDKLTAEMEGILNPSFAKSAWALSGCQGKTGLTRILRAADLLTNGYHILQTKRVQAAITLMGHRLDEARRVLEDIVKNQRGLHPVARQPLVTAALGALAEVAQSKCIASQGRHEELFEKP